MVKGYGRKTRRSIARCQYTDEVTDLLARRIRKMPEYANCKIESMGPFGLSAECSISVKNGEELLGFLTVRYGNHDGSFAYVDYDAPKNRFYPIGSIGHINGFDRPTRPLPTDIDEAVKLVLKVS